MDLPESGFAVYWMFLQPEVDSLVVQTLSKSGYRYFILVDTEQITGYKHFVLVDAERIPRQIAGYSAQTEL